MATRGRLFWFDVPLVLVLLLGAGVAHADPSQSDIATAKRLFSEATALRAEGKWEEAVTKLEAAISIKETVGLRFHVAYCEAKLGRLLAARLTMIAPTR